MLSLNDIISKFKKKYTEAISTTGEKLSALTDNVDVLVDVLNDDEQAQRVKQADVYGLENAYDVVQAISDIFDGYTTTSGELDSDLVDIITFTCEETEYTKTIRANGTVALTITPLSSTSIHLTWRSLCNGQDEWISWEGWFNDLISKYSTSQIVVKACELAQRGELTAVNLRSFFGDVVSQNGSEAKQVLDIICDSVNGSSIASQSAGLIAALRTIFSGSEGMVANDSTGEIQFSRSDFRVNTAICFDLSTVVSAASTLLAMITATISPVMSAVTLGLGAAVRGVVESISANDGSNWKYLSDGEFDFEGYAPPVFQIEIPDSQVPTGFKSRIDDANGFCKFQSGWLVVFGWSLNNSRYRFEGFISTRADLKRYADGSGGLFNFVKNLVQESGLNCSYASTIADANGFKTNMTYWLNSEAMGGAQLPWTADLNFYGDKILYNATTNKFLMGVALLCYLDAVINRSILAGLTDNAVTYQDWTQDDRAGRTDQQILMSYMLAYNQVIAPNVSNPYYFNNMNVYVAGAVNNVIPCLRSRFNMQSEALLAILESLGFHDTLDNTLDGLGIGSAWASSYDMVAQGNPQIFPPTSTASLWVKAAISAIATAAIIAAAAVTAVVIKRRIQYKAYKQRSNITHQVEQWSREGHQLTYDEFVNVNRQARRYNRFWGKLAGNTLDVNNNWLSYNTDSEVSYAGVSSRLINVGGNALVPSVDTLLYKLISGKDPE